MTSTVDDAQGIASRVLAILAEQLAEASVVTPMAGGEKHPTKLLTEAELLAGLRLEQVRRGVRPNSIHARERRLMQFMAWLDGRSILGATRADVEAWLDACQIQPETRRNYLSHVTAFYRWAVEEGLVAEDPTRKITSPKQRLGLPRPIADGDLARALAATLPTPAVNPELGEESLESYAERWLAQRTADGRPLAGATVLEYEKLFARTIFPAFGGLPLNAITGDAVKAWHRQVKEERGPDTASRSYLALRRILTAAVDEGRLRRNPCRREEGWERRHDDQMARIRCFLLLGAYQGLRCKEMAGLQVEDVDRVAGVLRVRDGKGGKDRAISLHPEVLEALDALPMPRSGLIFRTIDGRPLPPHMPSHIVGIFLRSLGIRASAHQLRHWFGTNVYRKSGCDLLLTQRLLGHASPTVTAVYAAADPAKAAPVVLALTIRGE